MQTYLDATVASFCRSIPARWLVNHEAEDVICELMGRLQAALDDHAFMVDARNRAALEFMRAIRLLMRPQLARGAVRAFSVAGESVGLFRSSKPSEAVRATSIAEIAGQAVTFVNVPHHCFPVAGNLQVRGILATPKAGGIHLTAAVAPRGSNRVRHMRWRLGETVPQDVSDISVDSDSRHGRSMDWIVDVHERSIQHHLGLRPRTLAAFLKQVENVMLLTVAQHRSIVDAGGADVEEVPHLPVGDRRRYSGNRKAVARNYSLFRIRRLTHLDGITIMYERNRADTRSSACVAHDGPIRLCDVRGHFRMQAYGRMRALRKLIWVSPHQRWISSDGKTVMHALPVATDVH